MSRQLPPQHLRGCQACLEITAWGQEHRGQPELSFGSEAGAGPSHLPALIFPEQECVHGISSAGAGNRAQPPPQRAPGWGSCQAGAQPALPGEDAPKSRDGETLHW